MPPGCMQASQEKTGAQEDTRPEQARAGPGAQRPRGAQPAGRGGAPASHMAPYRHAAWREVRGGWEAGFGSGSPGAWLQPTAHTPSIYGAAPPQLWAVGGGGGPQDPFRRVCGGHGQPAVVSESGEVTHRPRPHGEGAQGRVGCPRACGDTPGPHSGWSGQGQPSRAGADPRLGRPQVAERSVRGVLINSPPPPRWGEDTGPAPRPGPRDRAAAGLDLHPPDTARPRGRVCRARGPRQAGRRAPGSELHSCWASRRCGAGGHGTAGGAEDSAEVGVRKAPVRPRRGDRDAPGTRAVARLGPRATPRTGVRGHCCHRRGWAGPAGSGDTGPAAVLQGGQEAGGDRAPGTSTALPPPSAEGTLQAGPAHLPQPCCLRPGPGGRVGNAGWPTRGTAAGFPGGCCLGPRGPGTQAPKGCGRGDQPQHRASGSAARPAERQ